LGASTPLLEVNDQYNRTISTRLVEKLKPYLRPGSTVAVLGLAYKPLSHVIEESSGISLCLTLGNQGLRVVGYDPLVREEAQAVLHMHALVTDSLASCLQDAESILVTTPDEMFKTLNPEDCLGTKEAITVVDFWRCLPDSFRSHPKIRYVPIGQCNDDIMVTQKLEQIYHDNTA
jgi:UDP-glucose 6-dehydrogenase